MRSLTLRLRSGQANRRAGSETRSEQLHRLFRLPMYPDEEQARTAHMLLAILSILTIAAVAVLIVSVLASQSRTAQIILAGSIVLPIAFWLLRRGHLQVASLCVMLVLLSVLTYLLYVSEGIHDIALTAYPTVIVIGSLLLGRRGAVIGTALSIVAVGLVFVAEGQGVAISPQPEGLGVAQRGSPGEFAILVALLCLTGAMVELLASNMRRSLKRARRKERAQIEANRELRAIRDSLEQRVAERTAQLSVSAEVSRAITSVLDPDDLIRQVAHLITERFGFTYAAVYLLDESGRFAILREATPPPLSLPPSERGELEGRQAQASLPLHSRDLRQAAGAAGTPPAVPHGDAVPAGASEHRLEIGGQSMVGAAIVSREPRVARDPSAALPTPSGRGLRRAGVGDPSARHGDAVPAPRTGETAHFAATSEVALPLLVGDRVLGALDVQSRQPDAFDEDSLAVLQSLADQVAIALNNAQQYREAQLDARQATALFEASRLAGFISEDLSAAADYLLRTVAEQAGFDSWMAAVYEADSGTTTLLCAFQDPARRPTADMDTRMGGMDMPNTLAIRMRQAVVINDPEVDPLLSQALPAERDPSTTLRAGAYGRSVSVPAVLGDRVVGAISLGRAIDKSPISARDVQLAQAIANQLAVTIENRRLFEQSRTAVAELNSLMQRYTHEGWARFSQTRHATVEHEFSRTEDFEEGESRVPTALAPDRGSRGLAVPIELRGEVIGTLDVQAEGDHQWSRDELVMLKAVADQVAQSVEAARLLDETEASLQETVKLYEASRAMAAAATPAEVMHTVVSVLHGYLEVDQVSVVLFDEEQGYAQVVAQAVPTPPSAAHAQAIRVPLAPDSEALAMLAHGQTIVVSPNVSPGAQVPGVEGSGGADTGGTLLAPRPAGMADIARSSQLGRIGESFLMLPLVVGQRLIGFVSAQSDPSLGSLISSARDPSTSLRAGFANRAGFAGQVRAPREFRDNEIAFCETLARQAAVALENRRLFEETRYRAEIESTLNRISQTIKASLDPQMVLDLQTTITEMGRAMRVSRSFYLANVDDRRFVVAYEWRDPSLWHEDAVSHAGAADESSSPSTALRSGLRGATGVWMDAPNVLEAFKAGESLLVGSVQRQGVPGLPPPLLARGALSHMHVPVVSGSRLIGVLGFDQIDRERRWLPEEASMVRRVADQLAAALENARLYQDVHARVNELTALMRIGRRLAASLQLEEVLNTIVEEAINITPADRGSIALYDPNRDALALRVLIGFPEAALTTIRENTYTVLRRGDGLHGRLLTTGQAVLVNDVLSDPEYIVADRDTRAELIVPIRQGEALLGALNLESPHAYAFGEPDQRLMEALADQAAVAIANARAYEAERAALDRMREVDRLKTQFLANMSHELRTPLNSIIGFSRVILRGIDGPLTEMQQADLTAIHNSGQHLLGLINDVLDLSKIEAGKMELAPEDTDLADVVKGVMSTAIALVKDKKVELHHEIPPDLPLVRADPRRIRQVVLNLVSNAAKFTETGRITTRISVHPTEVWVSVADTGMGIHEDKLEHIFEEFTQVDASTTRKAGGTGLGLAISRKFIEMHGGRMWAESQVGVGSTFTFTLPLAPDRGTRELARPTHAKTRYPHAVATRGESEDTPPVSLPKDANAGRPLILCIDDDPEVITLYQRFLETQGYQVIGLSDTDRAVQEAARLKPATIMLDALMPAERRDGWSILAELKSTPATRDIPIVVCTIARASADQNKGFALGAADYLVKPVSESDLMGALDRVERSEASAEALRSPRPEGAGNAVKGIQTVLVVDDELDAIRLLHRMLEGRPGVNVIEAQGGAMGIAAAQTYQPDVVLLDLMMPDIDGFAVLETLRGNRHTRDIPVIAVTAKDPTKEDRARLHGKMVAMLNKSAFDSERLMVEIAATLDRLTSRQPTRRAIPASLTDQLPLTSNHEGADVKSGRPL